MTLAPDQAVDQALDVLGDELGLTVAHTLDSHTVLTASGLEEPAVIEALGLYLVALIAGVVQTTLRLSTVLLDRSPEGRQQLAADVAARITPAAGAPAGSAAVFKANVRDPWIAEGIGHAMLAVRKRKATPCLSGAVAAMTVPHGKPSQQGLDLFAIYEENGLPAIALGEAKATAAGGSGRLTEAIGFFRKVQGGERDVDIRMQVVSLHDSLPANLQNGISAGFWHQRACYLPIIAHGDTVDISTSRPALQAIARSVDRKRVVYFHPSNYSGFFDRVAVSMRAAVSVINP